ncbi:hypothetical protein GGI25_004182 [Coemansia spiralis]|uniref:Secreted protein n=2 Tax=Coemansia TaxID=4863 RepID=A0A9W8G0S4_9FUNG|nr:hypothetical protein BX070DRAFT_233025 [Coemansia spiralis]KAJ1986613.1 hypothetical protein EDC05_006229 [Coemansia umbellata]KAJ2625010.1 hypothetical protein GGI26_001122 [Coemansia sp. RSA 1358]KAJ2674795.1 hypothetical protein GGI25_004182 [Coemansia spiralis]
MRLFAPTITLLATLLLSTPSDACTVSLRVARDATVSFNGIQCNNNTVPCSSIPLGLDNTLTSFKGNRDYRRILLGFDLPTNAPTGCVLRIPNTQDGLPVDVAVVRTDDTWDEQTVSGYTKRLDGSVVGSTTTGSLDVTGACKDAVNHKLSFFVDTNKDMVTFNSVQSGSPAVFSLDYSF